MMNARFAKIVQSGGLALLRLFGGGFVLVGLSGSVFRWLLQSRLPQPHWHIFFSVVIFLGAALVGLAVVFRFRLAAIVLSLCFGFLGAQETYGMIHGFFLPHPPDFAPVQIASMAGLALLPALMTALAWKRLR